jgi:MFS family permease
MIAAVYPHVARAKAMGIFNAAIPLGAGLGVMVGGTISVHFGGWRSPFFVFALPGLVLGILAFFLKDYKTVENIDEHGQIRGLFKSGFSLYKIPTMRWVYLSNAMMTTTAYSFLTWGPAYVMRVQGIDEEKAGLLIGILSLMAIIGAPLGGWLADTWNRSHPKGRIYMPLLSLVCMSIFFLLSIYFELKGIGLVFGFMLGVALVLPIPAYGALTQDVVTPDRKGMAFGMNTFSMYVLGGGWAPIVIGYVSDLFGGGARGLKWALMIASVGGILAALALFVASKTYLEDLNKVRGYRLEADN